MSTTTIVKPGEEMTGYAQSIRFYATRYTQGSRTVYALDLSLAQLGGLLPAPDPDNPQPGNRKIRPAHAAAFGNYVRNNPRWVAPAIVLRSGMEYDFEVLEEVEGTSFGIVSLPFLALTELHILDGQHRILGIHMAMRAVANELEKARAAVTRINARKEKSAEDAERETELQASIALLSTQRRRFERERTSVQIFVEDDQTFYQQMFYDISDNALGISASVRSRYDTTRPINRVLQELLAYPALANLVDLEDDRLGRQNPHLLSAKHLSDIVRILAVGIEGRVGRRVEAELDEARLLSTAQKYFDVIIAAFPLLQSVVAGEFSAAEIRMRSQIASPVMIKVLAGVYSDLKQRGLSDTRIKNYFSKLDRFLSVPASREWVERVGNALLFEGALAPTSRRQDLVTLSRLLVGWAEERPNWMNEADAAA